MEWTPILTAAVGSGGALAAIISALSQRYKAKKEQKARKNHANGYRRLSEIYKTLEFVRTSVRCTRVCVLKTENGGGIPAPGCDVKSSVLYENADYTMKRELASSWQKVLLNGIWAAILQEIAANQLATLKQVDGLDPRFNFLSESDCAKVQFVLIDLTPTAMFYMSVHLDKEVDLSEKEASNIAVGARRIKQLFNSNETE